MAETSAQTRAKINSRLSLTMAAVLSKQNAYLAAHGRYFQGLPTHSTRPKDGVDTAPDRLDAHPTDQAETWRSQAIIPAASSSSIRCDVYDGPLGKGYVITLEFVSDETGVDIIHSLSVNEGPETWRSRDWWTRPLAQEAG